MKRHIWFPYLDGTRCISCEQPKLAVVVAQPCPGRPPEEPVPAEPACPAPASPELERA